MSDLPYRLSQGTHPIEVSLRPEKTIKALKACLDRGYVHIRFTDTRGGTELGVPVDTARSDLTQADFEQETGSLRLVGQLTLDYVPVRCIAEIDVRSLAGQGHLEILAE
jgi:hypothetical protein